MKKNGQRRASRRHVAKSVRSDHGSVIPQTSFARPGRPRRCGRSAAATRAGMFTAWVARGKMCMTRLFVFVAGMRHSAASRSISLHSAGRGSPGLTNSIGDSVNPARSLRARLLGAPEARRGLSPCAFAETLLVFGLAKTRSTASRQAVPGVGDLWGAEEASPGHKQSSGLFVPGERQGLWPGAACKASPGVGARSALRKLTQRGCPNGANAVRAVSSATHPLGEQRRAVGRSTDRPSVNPHRAPPAATRAAHQNISSRCAWSVPACPRSRSCGR